MSDFKGLNAVFSNDRHIFDNKHAQFVDMLLAHVSLNIETRIKIGRIPVKHGLLKASVRSFKANDGSTPHTYRVEVGKEYAAPQEEGVINGSPIKNYTTPGTGSHWFLEAVQGELRNAPQVVNEVAKAIGL